MSSEQLLFKTFVIPAQAGIQLIKEISCEAGQYFCFVCYAGFFDLLDSRLRGNDVPMSCCG